VKYFYDTEFIEDGKIIDLISIGVVREDGAELYLESNEFDPDKASDWVKQNVFPHLRGSHGISCTREEIKEKLIKFVEASGDSDIEFWGYYSAYDHVALCQLFGTMMDLPKGWPMYTNDIKQLCESMGNPKLPEQGNNEHDALADARWNMKAWYFLRNL